MLIWTVKEGEPLPLPECPGRIMRCGIISQMLSDRGNTVIWWTSAYFHQKKCLLREAECVEKIKPNYLVHLLRPRILYKHNISIKRALYSLELSRLFRKAAESEEKPDLIYCSYPLIDLAYEVVKYAKVNNVPVVIDIRDLWPDIFYSSVPPIIKPVAKIAFHAEERKATYCVKNADMVECKYHAKYYHLSLVKDSSRIALWAERKGITSYKDNECAAIYCQGNYEEYLSGLSKNVRQNLRTANNRTVTDGREVALVVYNEEPVPEELIQKLCLLYEKRRMIKNQTMNRSHLQYRFTECIRRRNLKKYDITTEAMRSGRGFYLGVLFIDGIPAAFCFGPKSTDGTLCFMQVAIDDMFDRYSPGMLLLTRVFESMLNESGILSIDLTNGNETYKFLLGAKSHYTKCYVFVQ